MAPKTQTKETPAPVPALQGNSLAERFTTMVIKEFGSEVGKIELSPYQRKLAQHLFIKIDMALKDLDAKRASKGQDKKAPIIWQNVNMQKLAVDAVHRIELGLDALIPNHIHPIPYFNSSLGKYDLDLRVGYVGKDYYYREMALYPPTDIVYELVHKNDEFIVIKKGQSNQVESYIFKINNPFDRGPVVGGFGYVRYEDETKNRLQIVTMENFTRSKKAAQSDDFWSKDTEAMQYKTIVHRTVAKITLDPEKINASFVRVEQDEYDAPETPAQAEIEKNANKDVIDLKPTPKAGKAKEPASDDPPPMTEEEKASAMSEEEAFMAEDDAGNGLIPEWAQ